MSRVVKLAVGFGLAGVFLWLVLRRVDLDQVMAASRTVSWPMLALAPLFLALGYACRVQRWRLMLLPHNPALGFLGAGVPFVASIAVNNLAPLRLGDVMRCFVFSRWLGVAPGAVVASVLVERMLDMVALVLALALALWVSSVDGAALGLGLTVPLLLAALGIAGLGLLLSPRLSRALAAALVRVVGRFGAAPRAWAEGFLRPAVDGMSRLSEGRALSAVLALSVPVWLFEGATYWAVAQALPALAAPQAAWLAMPVGTLATLLPSTPGHIGTFDFFVQSATLEFGNAPGAATSFTLLVHLTLWLTTTLAGSVCLLVWALARRRGEAP